MEREGKREEEERKKREEEAKRGARMKKWLRSRKGKLREKRSMSDKQGLGPPGPGEGGVSNPDVEKFEECPVTNSLLRGGGSASQGKGVRGLRGRGEW